MMTARSIGHLGLALLLAIGATSCVVQKPVAPTDLDHPNTLRVLLVDGTLYRLEKGRTTNGNLCGRPLLCNGPSCTEVMSSGCTPTEAIANLTESKPSAAAWVMGVMGTAAAVGILVAATSSSSSSHTSSPPSSSSSNTNGGGRLGSCPRVYAWDGTRFSLDSGTFGVAYFASAPRTDFDLLDHLAADHGTYRLLLANEEDENEHTDLVKLKVVDHPAGTRVVPTAAGKLLTFRDELLPVSAEDLRGKDALELVSTKDDREWFSDLRDRKVTRAEDARDGLRLVFTKPKAAKRAKLHLAAHVTPWAGQMLGYLFAHRGPELPAWFAKMDTDAGARAELNTFLLREGMLNVRVKTPTGWVTRGIFWAAGSEIVKEEAFELEVADVPGETLEVELESALDFWSVDAASLAYGEDERVVVRELSASSAHAHDGRDITGTLARADAVRYDTVRGDVAELSFVAPPPPAAGAVRSFVLETSGYYVPTVAPAADADPAAIDALMKEPFAASRLALAFRIATPR